MAFKAVELRPANRRTSCEHHPQGQGAHLATQPQLYDPHTPRAQEATRQLKLSTAQQQALKDSLMGGLSYELTAQNNGHPCAYAFTEFELVTMPPGWAPPWKLCGKVAT